MIKWARSLWARLFRRGPKFSQEKMLVIDEQREFAPMPPGGYEELRVRANALATSKLMATMYPVTPKTEIYKVKELKWWM